MKKLITEQVEKEEGKLNIYFLLRSRNLEREEKD